MKPRIFVSSTYYDLKYIRNDLENFINNFGFESVLFESGDITFVPNNEIESSCYDEIKNCDMLILVVGGRYGSLSQRKDEYDNFTNSITLKEYLKAKENRIPVYIFVDKKVEAEYRTYLKNKDSDIKFAYVDSINVYKFIEKIYNNNDFVYTFENFDDIKSRLTDQWAGLMLLYLRELRESKQIQNLEVEIKNLKNISERIDIAIETILKKTADEKEIQAVNKQQSDILIKSSVRNFCGEFPPFEANTLS